MDRQGDRAAIWALLIPLICCGGAALWLLIAGTGLADAGALRASVWALVVGLVVAAVALF